MRFIGYGAMLMESFVAVMALIAASVLEPGVYFAMNSRAGLIGDDRGAGGDDHLQLGFRRLRPDMLTDDRAGALARRRSCRARAARRRWPSAWRKSCPDSSAAQA